MKGVIKVKTKEDTINKVILLGRLKNDPEPCYTSNRKLICTFNLVVKRESKSSIWEPDTDNIPVVLWDTEAKLVGDSCVKGNQIIIIGHIQIHSYHRYGKRHWMTEIVGEHVVLMQNNDSK